MKLQTDNLGPIDFGSFESDTPPEHLENLYRLGHRVMALMGWPNKQSERDGFLSTIYAAKIHGVRHAPIPHDFLRERPDLWKQVQERVVAEISEHDFIPSGGFGAVSAAPSIEEQFKKLRRKSNAWDSVSAQLLFCRSIELHHTQETRGGGSLGKARYILHRCTPWSETTLVDNWKRYRAVAHFCVAVDLLRGRLKPTGQRTDEAGPSTNSAGFIFFNGLPTLLAVAREYQNWACSFAPHSRSETILSRGQIWEIGDTTPHWTAQILPPPLDGEYLKALRAYEAPKPKKE